MTTLLFANNATSTLTTSILSSDTTINLVTGTGSLFPSPVSGEIFIGTIYNISSTLYEIVYVTARSGDELTIVRAQEGTNAAAWVSGSIFGMYPTAGTMNDLIQIDQLQNGTYSFYTAGGTVNALTANVNSNLTSLPDGFTLLLKSTGANTNASTLQINLVPTTGGSSTVISEVPITQNGNNPLSGGEIPSVNYLCVLIYNASYNSFVLQNGFLSTSGYATITNVQSENYYYGIASGGSDTISVSVPSGLTSLVDGAIIVFRAIYANTTTTPTLTVTYGSTTLSAKTIKKYNNQSLSANDIGGAGYVAQCIYNSSFNAWMLINPQPGPAGGVTSIAGGTGISVSAPAGAVTVNNTGVLTVNGASGTVSVTTSSIGAYPASNPSGFINSGYVALTGSNTISATNTFNGGNTFNGTNTYTGLNNFTAPGTGNAININVATIGTQGIFVTNGSIQGGISPSTLQLGLVGTGLQAQSGTSVSITNAVYGYNATFSNTGNNTQGNNNASWFVVSDAIIKTNIKPIIGSLDKINALKPSFFSYINDTKTINAGFIAQDFEKVFPDLVHEQQIPEKFKDLVPKNTETIKGITQELMPYLVNAIKELSMKQVELETKISIQAAYIAALQAKV